MNKNDVPVKITLYLGEIKYTLRQTQLSYTFKALLIIPTDAHNYKITGGEGSSLLHRVQHTPHNRLVCCHDIDHVIIEEDIEPYCSFS
jgi:hypothetical protein